MTVSNQQRQVTRAVKVYVCNRCAAEAVEEQATGWTMMLELEVQTVPTMMGTVVQQLGAKPSGDRHLCPGCTGAVNKVIGEQPAPVMVGNELANISIRTTTGDTVLLTRHEYERWAANGKPPVLDANQVKVKS